MESHQHAAATVIQKYMRSNACITKFRLMKKMNFKRNGIAKELLKTEENYVRRLTVLEDVFQRPLTEQCNSATPLVTRQDVRTLFGDVEVILGLNRVVLQEITAKLQSWTSAALLGDVFVKLGKVGAFRWYHSYVSNYDKAFALLKQLKSSSKQFKEFIELAEQRPELNFSDLESLLILPIQRIPQYNMLLSDLLKNTWTEHPDYKNIKQAVKTMHEIATLVNEKKRESENIERVLELEAKIDGFPQLAVPHRRFISDTVWQHVQTDGVDVTAPRDVHLLLFNDIILLAAEINERFWVEQYSYFGRVFLNENPTGVPNKEKSINIKMKDKVFGLTARDEKEKNSWCVSFLSTVQLARKLENDQRKLTEHKRNLTIKLSNRPTREMLTMRGIITPEASPISSPVAHERAVPQTARPTLQQARGDGDDDYSTEQASEGSDDYSATTAESSISVLQTDIFNIYLTPEQLQQRLTELFMPMLPNDLQVLLEARRSRARALYTMDVAVSKKKIVMHLIVITESRVLFLVKGKIVHEAHLLDIVTVRAKEDKALCIEFKNFKVEGVSEHTDDVINRLRRSFMANFPAMPEGAWFESDVEPINRLDPLPLDTYALSLPCGGFVNAYKSICNYLSIEPRGDIIWDMKNLYHVQRVKEFNFKMFELPETDDEYKAIMLALRYNPWFTHLIVRDNRLLSRDAANSIVNLFRHNYVLTNLDVANSSFTREAYTTLHEALVFNQSYTQLRYLDLSNTSVEDKGLTFLTSFIERCGDSVNVEHIDLTNTNLSSRGLATLFNCFKKCAPLLDHLTYLNISDNRLDQEGSGVMSQWLALPNFKLRTIKLVNTQAHLPLVVPAVQRGCLRLTELDVSKNRFTDKVRPALVRLLQGNDSLKHIALNGTGMSAEALVELLSTVHSNSYLGAIAIEAAENNFGPAGAAAIAHQLRQMRGVTELNLRDNEFGDEGVGALCAALSSLDINPVTLHTLVLDGNFKFKNQKERSLLIKRLSALILASQVKLKKLSIAGGPRSSQQLKHELGPVLLSLAHNSRLEELNIKGHKLGNRGVFALARAIQTNSTLKNIQWDDNALTSPSLERIIAALKVNGSVKDGAVPPTDIAQLVTTEPTTATHFSSLLTVLSDRATLTPVNSMPPPKRRGPRSQKSSAVLAAPSSIESDTQSTSSVDRPASDQLPRRRAGSKSSKGSLEDVFSEADDSSRRTLLQRQSRRAANLREFVQSGGPSDESKPESVARKSEDNAVEKKKEKRKSARRNKQVTAKASDLVKAATDRKGNLTARDKRDKKEKRLSGKRDKTSKTSFETRQSDLERERLEAIKNMGQVDVNATPGIVPILSIATTVLKASDDRPKSPRTKKTKTPRDKSPKDDKPVTPHENPVVVVTANKSREPTPRQLSPRTPRAEDVKVEPVKTDVSPRTPRTEDVKVEPVKIPPPDATQVNTGTSPHSSREHTPRELTPREPSPRTPRTEDKVEPSTDVSPLRPPSRPLSVENSEDEADEPIGDLPVDDDDSEEENVRVVERQNSLVMRELDDEARALVNPSVAEIEAAMKSNVSDIQDKLDELLLAQEGEKDVHPEHAEDQHPEDLAEHHEDHGGEHDEHSLSEEGHNEHGADTPHSHSHENSEDEDESPDELKKHNEHSSELEEDNDEDESSHEYDEDHEDDVLVL